ncbi:MAG: haloacid dehalogenase type II [Thermoleophilaceae bacterium]
MTRPAVLAFDVNETLLDLAALDAPIERALGNASLRPEWFQLMLQLAFVGTITGDYVNFGSAQRAALQMIARRRGIDLDEDATAAVAQAMRQLPAHPDVSGALEHLAAGGLRLVAFTNSPLEVAREQLASAGIAGAFETVVSADEARQVKPGRRAYELAAERCGVDMGELMLVAAHHWDVSGAMAAGARAAFVARPGMVPSPLDAQPELVVGDLDELAGHLLDLG